LPLRRQSLLFSATMPTEVADLAGKMLRDPQRVEVAPWRKSDERIEQHIYHVDAANKPALLCHLLNNQDLAKVIVFTRTKHGANRLAQRLEKAEIKADAIHGNKSQGARQRALESFRSGQVRVLVATDIAARGIDVDDVSHVVNYELPDVAENYVHRIGRTARGGAKGKAVTFCASDEVGQVKAIEKLITTILPVVEDHPYHIVHAPQAGVKKRGQGFHQPQSEMHRLSQRRSRTRRAA